RWSAPAPVCTVDVAFDKPANQSSTARGGDARNANDGKLITIHDGKYCAETRPDQQSPWWQVDLIGAHEVRAVRIVARNLAATGPAAGSGTPILGLRDFEIRVGNSSTISGNRLCAWHPSAHEDGSARDFSCANPIIGRYVSIQMVGIEAALTLCEMFVFSSKVRQDAQSKAEQSIAK
ncbi:hypothetical protein GZH46_01790, partial [Fragariocoptes setiger]